MGCGKLAGIRVTHITVLVSIIYRIHLDLAGRIRSAIVNPGVRTYFMFIQDLRQVPDAMPDSVPIMRLRQIILCKGQTNHVGFVSGPKSEMPPKGGISQNLMDGAA